MTIKTLNLHLEPLEQRQMLDGDVTVSFNAVGDLRVTGDSQSNELMIQIANGAVRFIGKSDTTINGSEQSVSLSGNHVRDLRINMRGGDDNVTLVNATPNALGFRNGRINGGAGNDEVNVGSEVEFSRDLIIALAGGTSAQTAADQHVSLNGSVVGRNLTVRGAATADEVTIVGTAVGGKTNINMGGGNDSALLAGMTLAGSVIANMGAGEDRVDLGDLQAGRVTTHSSVRINMGAGNDWLNFNDLVSHGLVRAYGGQGLDGLYEDQFVVNVAPVIHGFEAHFFNV